MKSDDIVASCTTGASACGASSVAQRGRCSCSLTLVSMFRVLRSVTRPVSCTTLFPPCACTRQLPFLALEPQVAHRAPPSQAHQDRRLSVGHETSAWPPSRLPTGSRRTQQLGAAGASQLKSSGQTAQQRQPARRRPAGDQTVSMIMLGSCMTHCSMTSSTAAAPSQSPQR
jgi:hypothetical protein